MRPLRYLLPCCPLALSCLSPGHTLAFHRIRVLRCSQDHTPAFHRITLLPFTGSHSCLSQEHTPAFHRITLLPFTGSRSCLSQDHAPAFHRITLLPFTGWPSSLSLLGSSSLLKWLCTTCLYVMHDLESCPQCKNSHQSSRNTLATTCFTGVSHYISCLPLTTKLQGAVVVVIGMAMVVVFAAR